MKENERPVIGTPNAIEVLLHCHVSPGPHPRRSAPAVTHALERLRALGAITPDEDGPEDAWRTTALGRAWVEALCRIAVPRMVYMDEHGNVLS